MKVLVVVPTYNERTNVAPLLEAVFSQSVDDLAVLFVDDNSPDGTGSEVERLHDCYGGRVHVLHRTAKQGLGKAYVAGFRYALSTDAAVIVQMDADFSHDPTYLVSLIAGTQQADMVIGSRWVHGGSVSATWSSSRKSLSWFANRLYLPWVLGIRIRDATGGFRAWRRSALEQLDLESIRSEGYIFQVEMCMLALAKHLDVMEIPIHFPDREFGTSKMTTRIKLEAALRAIGLRRLRPRARRVPTTTARTPRHRA